MDTQQHADINTNSREDYDVVVQGGSDQGLPVIVSKVASNTPADLCLPRLNEGDQVLFINGRDISSLTHEQVRHFLFFVSSDKRQVCDILLHSPAAVSIFPLPGFISCDGSVT